MRRHGGMNMEMERYDIHSRYAKRVTVVGIKPGTVLPATPEQMRLVDRIRTEFAKKSMDERRQILRENAYVFKIRGIDIETYPIKMGWIDHW